ncbi:hypothetical protein FOF46_23435 [Aquimarina algiphila]|uniref:Uncharacterized protein n=2 Tax=Aquimarina algiphila TaxID=2047982 RepID=A0A554VE06_9FLAO|nr:hypothetical protein [Aquimarina algiphila]TSE05219.1 hypothetical protein FOF46_23435 [Aquimarina algiphila]
MKDQFNEDIDPLIKVYKPIERQEIMLSKAGYKVEKGTLIYDSKQFIEVYDPNEDIVDGLLRKVVFIFDGTGTIFEKLTVTETPLKPDYTKEKKIF